MSALWNASLNDYDKFPDPPALPHVQDPFFCESNRGLRAFLSASRKLSDDVLKQRLNSILNNKDSTKDELCQGFLQNVIIKSWNERIKGLRYCENVVLASLKADLQTEDEKLNQIINNDVLRLDPYAQRDIENAKELKSQRINQLQNFLENEKSIERIVQAKSRDQIIDTCGLSDLMKDLQL